MGIRAAWKEDLKATSAELVFGETIRLPGQFLEESSEENTEIGDYLRTLKEAVQKLKPRIKRHGQIPTFVFKDIQTATHVFLRHDAPTRALQLPYDGPYEVLSRTEKITKLKINGKAMTVLTDRIKPAYLLTEDTQRKEASTQKNTTPQETTRSGRKIHQPVRFQSGV